jgi:hypothetical protein
LYQKENYELKIHFESDLLVCVWGPCFLQRLKVELAHHQCQKNPYHVLDFYVQDWRWMGSIFNSYLCDLVLLYWFLSGNIFLIWDFLPDEMVNLWIFTVGLTSAECQPHMSSIWPWSSAPKVHLYNTFLGVLRHLPPQMKKYHGLNEENTFIGKKLSLKWVLVMWHVWLVWILTTKHKSMKRVENFERYVIFSCYYSFIC